VTLRERLTGGRPVGPKLAGRGVSLYGRMAPVSTGGPVKPDARFAAQFVWFKVVCCCKRPVDSKAQEYSQVKAVSLTQTSKIGCSGLPKEGCWLRVW